MSKGSVVKVVGPLAAYAPGFGRELKKRGYTKLSVTQQLRLAAHVSRWLDAEASKLRDLHRSGSRRSALPVGARATPTCAPRERFDRSKSFSRAAG
jgi:hypothetical protein